MYTICCEKKKTVKEVMKITGRSKTEVEAAQIASVLLDHPDWSIDRVKESIAGKKPKTVKSSNIVTASDSPAYIHSSASPEDADTKRLCGMVDATKSHLNDLFLSILQV